MAKTKEQKIYKFETTKDSYKLSVDKRGNDNRFHSVSCPKPLIMSVFNAETEQNEMKTLRRNQVEKFLWEQVAPYYTK